MEPFAAGVRLGGAPEHRAISRRLAKESVVLLTNDGTLPIQGGRVAVAGPLADDPLALLGCYAFAHHHSGRNIDRPECSHTLWA